MDHSVATAERLTESTFKVDFGKAQEMFTDTHIEKECFLSSAEIMNADFSNIDAILKQRNCKCQAQVEQEGLVKLAW